MWDNREEKEEDKRQVTSFCKNNMVQMPLNFS